jgi:hypothetical protein
MNRKFRNLILTIAILIIFLILAVFITHSGIFKNSIKSDISYLNSTKLSGRLTGTKEALESSKTGRVEIKFNYTDELIQANNIVAKIKGKDSSNALVLSAHFDHVGSAGKVSI